MSSGYYQNSKVYPFCCSIYDTFNSTYRSKEKRKIRASNCEASKQVEKYCEDCGGFPNYMQGLYWDNSPISGTDPDNLNSFWGYKPYYAKF